MIDRTVSRRNSIRTVQLEMEKMLTSVFACNFFEGIVMLGAPQGCLVIDNAFALIAGRPGWLGRMSGIPLDWTTKPIPAIPW